MTECDNCSTEVPDGLAICPDCGTRQDNLQKEPTYGGDPDE